MGGTSNILDLSVHERTMTNIQNWPRYSVYPAQLWIQRICYFHYIQFVRWNLISDELYYAVNEKMFYVTGMFLYLNSTINPIIYNIMSAKYRKAFRVTFLLTRAQHDRWGLWVLYICSVEANLSFYLRHLDCPSIRTSTSMVSKSTVRQLSCHSRQLSQPSGQNIQLSQLGGQNGQLSQLSGQNIQLSQLSGQNGQLSQNHHVVRGSIEMVAEDRV